MADRAIIGAACASLFLVGCVSDLSVKRLDAGSTPVEGYPYRLAMTQYSIPVTWRVVKCDPADPKGLKIKISAEVTAKSVSDPERFYVVDPRSLSGAFRNTEFSMEWYDSRGTKSITSSVDDQTGPALVNIATGVVKLAGAGLLPGGAGTATCSKDVVDALAAIGDDDNPGQSATVDDGQALVDELTLKLARITARAAEMGANIDSRTRRELGDSTRLLEAENARLKLENARLDKLLEVVTATKTVTFPTRGSQFVDDGPVPLPAKAAKDWNVDTGTLHTTEVRFRLAALETLPAAASSSGTGATAKTAKGLPYREPLLSRLEVCSPDPCGTPGATVVKISDGLALQTGKLFYLPFQGRTFASIKSGATFSEGGVLQTANFNQPRGTGVGAAQTFNDVSAQAAAFVTAQRGAETARIQAKADQAKAQKALNDAVEALNPAPVPPDDKKKAIVAFETDTALAKAETASIEADIALAAARKLLDQ